MENPISEMVELTERLDVPGLAKHLLDAGCTNEFSHAKVRRELKSIKAANQFVERQADRLRASVLKWEEALDFLTDCAHDDF
jgi:hypothetical protein